MRFRKFVTMAVGLVRSVVFALLVSATALASTETVLYEFGGTPDGSAPVSGLVRDKAGNLYGVTGAGGVDGQGIVYELSPKAGGGWTEAVLHSFTTGGIDGYDPGSGLTIDAKGNLFGTTVFGGTHVFGTVFELSPGAGGNWTETILYNFTGQNDGGLPQYGSLVFDTDGNLYGTTQNFGANGYGVAFKLSPSSGGWTETVLHAFADNSTDGGYPIGVVFDSLGNLYGPAVQGGTYSRGVVFELSTSKDGSWKETILHNFGAVNDGATPIASLVVYRNALYGTTEHGGAFSSGAVYRIGRTKAGVAEQVLYSFKGGSDGLAPESSVVFDNAGHLYGTTYGGGAPGFGTVFELSKSTKGVTENLLYSFTGGSDGGYSYSALILDAEGNLYGTTNGGGNGSAGNGSGNGVVFEVTP